MSEFLIESHSEVLTEIIRGLSTGEKPLALMDQFKNECLSITQGEVSKIFRQLNSEGVTFQRNSAMADFYEEVVEEKINASELNKYVQGHPVRVYLEENLLLRKLLSKIIKVKPEKNSEEFSSLFQQIAQIELHYARKENQLFPYLEKHGWDSPSKNMWAFHDDNRAKIKKVQAALDNKDLENKFIEVRSHFSELHHELIRMMEIEESRLFPKAMDLLSDEEWMEMRAGDKEIGWMLDQEPAPFPVTTYSTTPSATSLSKKEHKALAKKSGKVEFSENESSHYDEGYLTPDQVNLIFRHLPMDVTYVDENDRVAFYNKGDDRVFRRSPGIIGREVRYCHPQKSVDHVLRIVDEFKQGTKDIADFRISLKGRMIHIRYFAVRDEQKKYRGVLEMSQDITEIKTLEGEKRLLDWE